MSVGGKVTEVIRCVDQTIYINTNDGHNDECAIYVQEDSNSLKVRPDDTVWWQGRKAFWTPKDASVVEVELTRVGYSGVNRPEPGKGGYNQTLDTTMDQPKDYLDQYHTWRNQICADGLIIKKGSAPEIIISHAQTTISDMAAKARDTELFSQLTNSQIERLSILGEEGAEIGQLTSKIIRHGFESMHPNEQEHRSNRDHLERELGDIILAITHLSYKRDVDFLKIISHAEHKLKSVGKFLHHNDLAQDSSEYNGVREQLKRLGQCVKVTSNE